MSSYMQYRVPIVDSNDGYIISNCSVYGHYEVADRLIGDVKRIPIVMRNMGSSIKNTNYYTSSDPIPQSVWERAIKGNSTKNWFLTSIRINQASIDFYFSYKDRKKEGRIVSVRAEQDIKIWIYVPRVPRDDSLLDETYLIESVCDTSIPTSRGGGYHIRVTEFYRYMKREITVVNERNPYYNPLIHPMCLRDIEFLLVTECRDQNA